MCSHFTDENDDVIPVSEQNQETAPAAVAVLLTLQQIFDAAAVFLRFQEKRCTEGGDGIGACRYRGPARGLYTPRCIAGLFIRDEHYSEDTEGNILASSFSDRKGFYKDFVDGHHEARYNALKASGYPVDDKSAWEMLTKLQTIHDTRYLHHGDEQNIANIRDGLNRLADTYSLNNGLVKVIYP